MDYLTWMAKNLWIQTLDGDLVPLMANTAQLSVHKALQMQASADIPVRAIILKARREGVSTYVQGRFFCDINTRPNRHATIVSADLDASDKVFNMSKLFQEKIPFPKKTSHSSRKEIKYASPHRSSFLVQTAGKGVLGRGGMCHYLHATEFAFWDRAKEQFGGAAQEVPDRKNTAIIIESTANGVGDAFYDIFWQAFEDWKNTRDLNNYLPIFLPWFDFPEYQRPVPEEFKLDDEEHYLHNQFEVTNNQLQWRRWAIKNKCQSDLSLFRQEYPATAQEAFQYAGTPVFGSGIINTQRKGLESYRTVIFTEDGPEDVERTTNCWFMIEPATHEYSMGIDPMEGKAVDPGDKKSDIDYHGAAIYDRYRNQFVCIYHGRGPQSELGKQCLWAAGYYNNAWVAPEVNKGGELLYVLKNAGYENIYNRVIHRERMDSDDSYDLGFKTTVTTRALLVESFLTAVREGLQVRFPQILSEMETFVKDKTGKPVHNVGKHDDLLFAAMIALRVHLDCPIEEPYPFNETGVDTPPTQNINDLAYIGAIDPGFFEDEEDEYTS